METSDSDQVDRSLKMMLDLARAQLKATEKLRKLNQKNLKDAKALIKIAKLDARGTNEFPVSSKRHLYAIAAAVKVGK